MTELFPQIRNLIASDPYFTNFKTLDDGILKIYDEDDSPSLEYPFLTIEIQYGQKTRHTDWVKPFVTFHATGPNEIDKEKGYYGKKTLMEICKNCERIVKATNCLPALTDPDDPAIDFPVITYEVMGDSEYDQGRDPIIEMVTQSVALRLGFVSA